MACFFLEPFRLSTATGLCIVVQGSAGCSQDPRRRLHKGTGSQAYLSRPPLLPFPHPEALYEATPAAGVALRRPSAPASQASLVEEFKREIWTMHSLPPHRNVLALLGACTTPPRLAIVTEFCPLGSVYGLLHSPGCHLSWAQIIYMCLGAASGMAHLHRHNVLHRDLKSGKRTSI